MNASKARRVPAPSRLKKGAHADSKKALSFPDDRLLPRSGA